MIQPCDIFFALSDAGLMCMPHVKSEKYEWMMPFMALLSSFIMLIVLPVIVYAARFPHMACT